MNYAPDIPGYQIIQRLGGGPLTTVYSARDLEAQQDVAMKCLRPDWNDQPTAMKLLQREARAGLRTRHSHLVSILKAHVLSPPYFLVMALLSGESLQRHLQRCYALPLHNALWIARQTAEAIAALHASGFVHGDVKPGNVQLVDDGTAVLLDLGFAHRPGENAHFLRQGYVLGTPDYLAPELCRSQPFADKSCDLFSLGVMLFEMLTGSLPFPPGSIDQTFRRHGCDPPADIRRYAPALPVPLVRLMERLLSREPEERPPAHAVVQQLIALEIGSLSRSRAA